MAGPSAFRSVLVATMDIMNTMRSIALFLLAAVAEIAGAVCCLVGVAIIMYAPRG